MAASTRKKFTAVLEPVAKGPRFLFVRVPLDLKKAWPEWRTRRVIGEINAFPFSSTLFPAAKGTQHFLIVNKRMQAGARATVGSKVQIWLEPEMNEKIYELPRELAGALKGDRKLRRWFDALSPSMRKGIGNFVDQAQGAKTREMRAERMAESLMLAMEGEEYPPPILRAAFQAQPLALQGWNAMSSTQRRNHLLGIFYVQTVEGRQRRAAKAVDDAVRVARIKTGRA
jgi:uncharacterized protein YdeI (YjbR/CyaY-like superfamily)